MSRSADTRRWSAGTRRWALPVALSLLLSGCMLVGRPSERRAPPPPDAQPAPTEPRGAEPDATPTRDRYPDGYLVEYRASCSVRNECRITYRDDEGDLRSEIVVGDWSHEFRVPRGHKLWVRAAAGGCSILGPRATILVDGELRAEKSGSPDPAVSCQWVTAEAEYDLP